MPSSFVTSLPGLIATAEADPNLDSPIESPIENGPGHTLKAARKSICELNLVRI